MPMPGGLGQTIKISGPLLLSLLRPTMPEEVMQVSAAGMSQLYEMIFRGTKLVWDEACNADISIIMCKANVHTGNMTQTLYYHIHVCSCFAYMACCIIAKCLNIHTVNNDVGLVCCCLCLLSFTHKICTHDITYACFTQV